MGVVGFLPYQQGRTVASVSERHPEDSASSPDFPPCTSGQEGTTEDFNQFSQLTNYLCSISPALCYSG